jgi:hypothetical protein
MMRANAFAATYLFILVEQQFDRFALNFADVNPAAFRCIRLRELWLPPREFV